MTAAWRKALARVSPWHIRLRLASQLREGARAARADGQWRDAGALYAASLRLDDDPRIAIQAGHMFKETGDWLRAEQLYLRALARLGSDADLSLQLGHFYKISGQLDEAIRWYRQAIELAPDWSEPKGELAGLGSIFQSRRDPAVDKQALLPELLPDAAVPERMDLDRIVLRRFGSVPGADTPDHMPTLVGVDCIRGMSLSRAPILRAETLIEGKVIAAVDTVVHPTETPGLFKHVFNIWADFGALSKGSHRLEIRLTDPEGVVRRIQRDAFVGTGLDERSCPDSDGVVDPPPAGQDLAMAITSRPSVVRAARTSYFAQAPRSILVIRADQLGDMAVSVPAIRRLRAIAPQARLVGLVTRANEDLARSLDLFDDLEAVEWINATTTADRRVTATEQRRLADALAAYRFDVAIDLLLNAETRPLLKLSGAPCLIGFASASAPWLTVAVDSRTRDPKTGQEIAPHAGRVLALVERFGSLVDEAPCVVTLPRENRSRIARWVVSDRHYAVLHGGGRLAHLRWPHFSRLAERLLAETDLDVVMFGDADMLATAPADPRIKAVQGELAFNDFDAMLAFATVFIGNDSGPKHLAALRGTPTVSIHSARIDWREWAQTGNGLVVSRRVPCAGCGLHGEQENECGRDYTCIGDIRVEEVMTAITTLLTMPKL